MSANGSRDETGSPKQRLRALGTRGYTSNVRLVSLLLLAGFACTPPPAETPLESALRMARSRGVPVLAVFAGEGLALGARLQKAVADDARLAALAERIELDPEEDRALFEQAMGTRGRLGLVWLDHGGDVLSVMPGLAPPLDIHERARLVRDLNRYYRTSDGTLEGRLLRLQMELRAFAPAEITLRSMIAVEDSAALRATLARCLVRRGKIAEALAEAQRAACLDPEGPIQESIRLTRALARIASGEPRVALGLLEGDYAQRSTGYQADQFLLALGTARHDARVGDGLEELGGLIKRYPGSAWLPDVRRQVEHVLSPPAGHSHR